MTPKERAKDQRLRKLYRWTLEMYNALGEAQGWKCAGCGREAKNMPLNLDHQHFKIEAHRIITEYPNPEVLWEAETLVNGLHLVQRGKTRAATVAALRKRALPLSVRGLLCAGRYAGCNRKLGRIDNPVWLKSILGYLENLPARKVIYDPVQYDANRSRE